MRLRKFLARGGVRHHAMIVGAGDYQWTTRLRPSSDVYASGLPADVELRNAAGSYDASYARTEDGVRIVRRLVIPRDVFQAADDPALEALLYAALQDARATLVLSRPEAVAAAP